MRGDGVCAPVDLRKSRSRSSANVDFELRSLSSIQYQ